MNSQYIPTTSLGINKKCPVCKKMFTIYDYNAHAFKIMKNNNHVPVCSWGCIRSYEKKHMSKQEARRKEMIKKQLQGIQEGY